MANLYRTTALALIMGAGVIAAPVQAQTATQGQAQNMTQEQCRTLMTEAGAEGETDAGALMADRERVFGMFDRVGEDTASRERFRDCLVTMGADREQVMVIYAAYEEERGETTGTGQGAQIAVEQAQPTVNVQQPQPEVTVQQAQPTVNVEQPQPEVTVQQAEPTVTVQQPQPEVTVQQAQPQVSVEQPPPQVEVQQAEPKVQVEQAEPRVVVERAEPQVQVEQAEPRVQVEQAEPRVAVEQQGEPRVAVERQGEPEVQVERTEQQTTEQQTQAATEVERQPEAAARVNERPAETQTTARTWGDGTPIDMNTLRIDEMLGQNVVNLEGEEVGEIEDIVLSQQDKEAAFAVISVGGFLGLGAKDVAVPFSELQMGADNMILMSQKSEDELKDMPAYDQNQYTPYQR